MKPAAEKRTARRVRVDSSVRVKVPSPGGEVVELDARTRDISRNGAFLYVDHEVTAGSRLELIVMLPEEISEGGRAWVCCQGTVVRVEEGHPSGDRGPSRGIAAHFDRCSVLPEI